MDSEEKKEVRKKRKKRNVRVKENKGEITKQEINHKREKKETQKDRDTERARRKERVSLQETAKQTRRKTELAHSLAWFRREAVFTGNCCASGAGQWLPLQIKTQTWQPRVETLLTHQYWCLHIPSKGNCCVLVKAQIHCEPTCVQTWQQCRNDRQNVCSHCSAVWT